MSVVANLVVGIIALLHVYFMVLEMFFWDKPTGLRAFGLTQQAATDSKVLAAGLFWGLLAGANGSAIKIFFLSCVLVAGLYGAATANRKILFVQAIPAAVGFLLVLIS